MIEVKNINGEVIARLDGDDPALADFSLMDLSFADFRGWDLCLANFWEADLHGADFTEADLSCSNIYQASDLDGAVFDYAILPGRRSRNCGF